MLYIRPKERANPVLYGELEAWTNPPDQRRMTKAVAVNMKARQRNRAKRPVSSLRYTRRLMLLSWTQIGISPISFEGPSWIHRKQLPMMMNLIQPQLSC
jgi:hypothetical protein